MKKGRLSSLWRKKMPGEGGKGSEHPVRCPLYRGVLEVSDAEMQFKQCKHCAVANHHSPLQILWTWSCSPATLFLVLWKLGPAWDQWRKRDAEAMYSSPWPYLTRKAAFRWLWQPIPSIFFLSISDPSLASVFATCVSQAWQLQGNRDVYSPFSLFSTE